MSQPDWLTVTSEQEWLSSKEDWRLLNYLEERGGLSDRKWRLYACASVRRIWPLIGEPVCRQAVEGAERFADGLITPHDATAIREAAELLAWPTQAGYAPYTADFVASQAIVTVEGSNCSGQSRWVSGMVWQVDMATSDGYSDEKWATWSEVSANILRDLFGPFPFRPVTVDPALLKNDAIVKLAKDAYEHRRLPEGTLDPGRLGALADALEAAGCNDQEVLAHLRQAGEHYRGCWPLDLLLQKL